MERGLRASDHSVKVQLLDPLIGQGPAVVRQLAQLYPTIINRSRAAWGVVYRSSNTTAGFAAIRSVFGRQVRRRLSDDLRRLDPDLVISVHPLLNHVAHQAIAGSGRKRALVTVVTDLVDLHRGWICATADLIVVPTEAARDLVLSRSIPASRVRLLGLPVDLGFRPPAPGERAALRRRFGLDETRCTVLVAGGGEGAGGILAQVRALAWAAHPWQLVTVCGRNERLRQRLARVRFSTPNLVLGFVDNMPELMRSSDLIVTKAGPGAIAEALATGIPLILTGFLPGQETSNVDFVTSSGIGVYCPRPEHLESTLVELLKDGGRGVTDLADRTGAVARPYAALDIAGQCLILARSHMASGQSMR